MLFSWKMIDFGVKSLRWRYAGSFLSCFHWPELNYRSFHSAHLTVVCRSHVWRIKEAEALRSIPPTIFDQRWSLGPERCQTDTQSRAESGLAEDFGPDQLKYVALWPHSRSVRVDTTCLFSRGQTEAVWERYQTINYKNKTWCLT